MVARSDDAAMTIVLETPVRRWPCNVPDNIYTFKFPNLARLLQMNQHDVEERSDAHIIFSDGHDPKWLGDKHVPTKT